MIDYKQVTGQNVKLWYFTVYCLFLVFIAVYAQIYKIQLLSVVSIRYSVTIVSTWKKNFIFRPKYSNFKIIDNKITRFVDEK